MSATLCSSCSWCYSYEFWTTPPNFIAISRILNVLDFLKQFATLSRNTLNGCLGHIFSFLYQVSYSKFTSCSLTSSTPTYYCKLHRLTCRTIGSTEMSGHQLLNRRLLSLPCVIKRSFFGKFKPLEEHLHLTEDQ